MSEHVIAGQSFALTGARPKDPLLFLGDEQGIQGAMIFLEFDPESLVSLNTSLEPRSGTYDTIVLARGDIRINGVVNVGDRRHETIRARGHGHGHSNAR